MDLTDEDGLSTLPQLLGLFQEVIRLTLQEFGCTCVCSSNNLDQGLTPLMMIAERPFAILKDKELYQILTLMINGAPGLNWVDNHGNNALMLAASSNNEVFFEFFYQNWAFILYEGAPMFRWNVMNWQKNAMQDLVPTWMEASLIRTMIEQLKKLGVYYASEEEINVWRHCVHTRMLKELPPGMSVFTWCRTRAPRIMCR